MIVTKMRPRDVPVEILGLEIQGEGVGKQDVERTGDVLHGVGAQDRGRGEVRPATDLGFLGRHGRYSLVVADMCCLARLAPQPRRGQDGPRAQPGSPELRSGALPSTAAGARRGPILAGAARDGARLGRRAYERLSRSPGRSHRQAQRPGPGACCPRAARLSRQGEAASRRRVPGRVGDGEARRWWRARPPGRPSRPCSRRRRNSRT